MKREEQKISEGLNEIVEIINAKGDTGELKEIAAKAESCENSGNEKNKL